MADFKGSHYEREIVLWGVRWYMAYPINDGQHHNRGRGGGDTRRLTKIMH
jgi:hypothetical protein